MYVRAWQFLSKLHISCIHQRLAKISLPTLPSFTLGKTYVFIAMYRMVGAVLSAPCALVRATAKRGARPSPLTILLDAVGTTNAAALLHRRAAIVHSLLTMVAHVLLLLFPSVCLYYQVRLLGRCSCFTLAREFHPRWRARLFFTSQISNRVHRRIAAGSRWAPLT